LTSNCPFPCCLLCRFSCSGRPGYAPADLLKLYIYGYLNRVRSSRRLEMEIHRNIEVIWLSSFRMSPVGASIARFAAIRQLDRVYGSDSYHESIGNLTPADVYFGRGQTNLIERERIKRQTIANRRLLHQLKAA
jgi:hypothetical protein